MFKFRARLPLVTALTLAAAMLIGACSVTPGGQVPPTATVPPTEPATPAPSPTPGSDEHSLEPTPGGILTGTAQIETIDLLILESFPVQIHAHVVGWLGDGCTSLDQITQARVENTFTITITTARPAEAICTMQLVGFEETIPLEVAGLPAGTYTVDINGVTETFTLEVDNKLES